MFVCTARETRSRSPAPKYREITTPAPIDAPTKKLVRRWMRLPDELTAASASLPRKLPTIHESAVLYSCWNSWLRKIGVANETRTFHGLPSVKSRADCV